jgi:DNA-binding response OmpR family regulator
MINQLLFIEDDAAIGEMVAAHLTKEGFAVRVSRDGEEGIRQLRSASYDMLLLDWMLPGGIDGMEVLRLLRETSTMPVLILSAKDSDVDKALGLGLGADDYLAKPFSLIELTARIKAALRRANKYAAIEHAEEPGVLQAGELLMRTEDRSVTKSGEEIKLTAKEYEILQLFLSHPKRAYTKEQIYRLVWQDDYYGDVNAIQVHISRLRDKIEDDPANPRYVKTVWGIGYKLGDA